MSFDINFRTLNVFVLVAEARSMAVAAEKLKASPSTVSQHISNLEKNLNTQLVDRSARPITLTTAGRWFLPHAHKILDAVSAVRTEMMDLKLATLPSLKFAIMDGLDVVLTPDLMVALAEKFPGCQLTAWTGGSEEHFQALIKRDVDLIVTADRYLHHEILERHPVISEPLIVVTAKNALKKNKDLKQQLSAMPLIRYSYRLQIGRMIETHLNRIRWNVNYQNEFDSSRSIFATIVKYGGWALTTPICLFNTPHFRNQLDIYPTPFPTVNRTISLWARRDELAGLPVDLATMCRSLVQKSSRSELINLIPWVKDDFKVIKSDSQTNIVA